MMAVWTAVSLFMWLSRGIQAEHAGGQAMMCRAKLEPITPLDRDSSASTCIKIQKNIQGSRARSEVDQERVADTTPSVQCSEGPLLYYPQMNLAIAVAHKEKKALRHWHFGEADKEAVRTCAKIQESI